MNNFKQGDKLVCVKAGDPSLGLIEDKIYTCFSAFTTPLEENAVEVLESMPPQPYHGYLAWRFRKAVPSDLERIEKVETIKNYGTNKIYNR